MMPCRTGIYGGASSRRVGLSRPVLESVGVKSGVKDGGHPEQHPPKLSRRATTWTNRSRPRHYPVAVDIVQLPSTIMVAEAHPYVRGYPIPGWINGPTRPRRQCW